MQSRGPKILIPPAVALTAVLTPLLGWENLTAGAPLTPESLSLSHNVLAAAAWLAGSWAASRLLELVFWNAVVAPRLGGQVPRLLKDVGSAVLFLLALGGFIGITLGLPVTGLWATSGVVGLVVGFALQSMISDVFSGIAINIDRPFSIGHWIRVHPRGADILVGCVEEINWRSTRLRTADNVMHIIPNSLLGTMVVTNLSLP